MLIRTSISGNLLYIACIAFMNEMSKTRTPKMKILFITRGFPSDKDLMDGNYEAVQAKALAANGYDISVIAIKYRSLLYLYKYNKVKYRFVDGVHVYECNRLNLYNPFIHLTKMDLRFRQFQFRKVFQRYVRERGMPDVVHAHIVQWAAPAVCVKTKYHLPFVITEHWTKMNGDITPKKTMHKTFAYQFADRVICVSDALALSLQEKCGVTSLVIYNMVSNLFFKDRKVQRNDCDFRFVAVGAFRRNKGFDILVEAFALAHFPQTVKLYIVGDGEEKSLVEKKIHDLNIASQVVLLGRKTPEEVNDQLCQSDCFVLSSRLETFAIVVIEALAKGLPVIATRSGGPETFLRPEDGILIPKENPKELANAMIYMKDHYQLYNVEEIRQHCFESFSQDVIVNKLVDVYKQAIDNNNVG